MVERRLGFGFVAQVSLLCLATVCDGQQQSSPLSVEDLLSQKALIGYLPIALSPNGRYVAFTVKEPQRITEPYEFVTKSGVPRRLVGTGVWIADLENPSATSSLTGGLGNSWGTVWSPDGKYLAFYSDRAVVAQLWVWERATAKIRRVSETIVYAFNPTSGRAPMWTPDSKTLVVTALPQGLKSDDIAAFVKGTRKGDTLRPKFPESTVTIYQSKPGSPRQQLTGWVPEFKRADLAAISIDTGQTQFLTAGEKPVWFSISPDGAYVAYTTIKGGASDNRFQGLYDLSVVSLHTAAVQILAENIKLSGGSGVAWAPDGKSLAYVTGGPTGTGDVFLVSKNGGAPLSLTTGSHPKFTSAEHSIAWDQEGEILYVTAGDSLWRVSRTSESVGKVVTIAGHDISSIVVRFGNGGFWRPHKHSLYVATMNNIDKKNGIYRVDLSNGVASQRMEESKILGAIDAVDTPALMVATVEDAQHSPDIWAILPSGERTRVTHLNPQLDKYAFGVRQLISWRTSDGKEVQGVLALPADYTPGRRIPLIVSVYGGASFSEEINRFGVYAAAGIPQMFTTRGYAVLLPDCPVKPEAPMLGIAQAVLPGVDRVIEMGVADPERLGIMGMSYGGYSTLAILAQTNRFRAAVEEAGYADIVSVYGVLASNGEADKVAIQEDGQGLMRATPWENRAKYIENSPLFYLDRTSTPLLIIQGTLDRAVPPFLGDQIFVALTRLGREVEYAKFEGEEHGIESGPNVLERWDLIFNWFDSHLKSSD